MEMFLGTIVPVAFPFAPRGFMTCAGQLLSIAQNSALFSLLGTTYGGDGQNTFALPDLRGRVAVGAALGATGRIPADMGTVAGNATFTAVLNGTGAAAVTLTVANLPAHNHTATFAAGGGGSAATVHVSADVATTSQAAQDSYLAAGKAGGPNQPLMYRPDAGKGTVALNAATITGGGASGGTVTVDNTGSGTPLQAPVTVNVTGQIPTVPPFVGVQYIICVEGIFPSRN
ncbi:tail fiber protein [Massilia violaceinigra]|uniref:Tail fiber protein n=1 Tax=Massilia violaceinigra TaxID=2045208 RepID=A0ABY4A9T7_9BURK|nr:tail fiber protein [Massilia violaceinigra]UOD30434.1 tail fiber protein [Massilia violaceinigra]